MADLNEIKTFDWDDEVEAESNEFILLSEGEYFFKVAKFERGTFPGSAKIPPCNKAVLTLAVETDKGTAIVNDDIFLCDVTEWKISQFFISIGLKKHGERVKMKWNEAVGLTGRFKIRHDKWVGTDGKERTSMRVDRYMEPIEIPTAPSYEF